MSLAAISRLRESTSNCANSFSKAFIQSFLGRRNRSTLRALEALLECKAYGI
jgi:hypothetical protein